MPIAPIEPSATIKGTTAAGLTTEKHSEPQNREEILAPCDGAMHYSRGTLRGDPRMVVILLAVV